MEFSSHDSGGEDSFPSPLNGSVRPPLLDRALPLTLYVITFPLLLLGSLALPPDWQRFGFQWQALGLAVVMLVGSCCVVDGLLRSYLHWLVRFRVWRLIGLSWVYLMGMACAHGFLDQLQGLLSGLLASVILPLLVFLGVTVASRRVVVLLSLILLVLLGLENLFLSLYLVRGLAFNTVSLGGWSLPRLFLNVRDGNCLAIAVAAVAVAVRTSLHGGILLPGKCRAMPRSWLCIFAWFLAFYAGWLTQGRGVFVSLAVGCLAFILCGYCGAHTVHLPAALVRRVGLDAVTGCFLAWALFNGLSWLSGGGVWSGSEMMARLLAEAGLPRFGRLEIWGAWLKSGLSESVLWGHGLGVKPDGLSWLKEVYTPHDLWVQIIADSGIWGCLFFVVFVSCVVRVLSREHVVLAPVQVIVLGSLGLYLSVASVLFWPLGIWLVSLVPVAFSGQSKRPATLSGAGAGSRLAVMLLVCLPFLSWLIALKQAFYGFS